jgi:hypothetical protein
MSTQQPLSVRGALESTSSTIVGFLTLLFGVWLVFMTGYSIVVAIPVIVAGAIAFPATRGIVTLGRLRVGRWLHDAIAFFSWLIWLTIAYFIAQPWA